MEKEIKQLLDTVTEMKSGTDAELKLVKESVEAMTKGATENGAEIAELKDAVHALEQRSVGVKSGSKEQLAEEKAAQKDLFNQVIKTGRDVNGMPVEEILSEQKGFTVGDPLSAGAGIDEELSRSILTNMRETYSILGLIGNYAVQSTDHYRMVQKTWSGTTWAGENTANSAPSTLATPTFEKVTATFGKLTVDNFVTNESLVDPIFDVESFLMSDVQEQSGRAVAQAFIDGDGVNKPYGILSHFDSTESVKPDYDAATPANERSKNRFAYRKSGQANGLPTSDDSLISLFRDLILDLKTPYLANARFLMNRRVYDQIARIQDGEGRFYLQPDLSGKSAGSFLGYPISIEEHMPDADADGNIAVLFGDFAKAFNMIDYVGVSMLRNPYIVPGNVNFHWEQRVGSMIGDSWALKGLVIGA